MEYTELVKAVRSGDVRPVYALHGDEPFFIDRVTEVFEEWLPEAQRSFDLTILYGKDVAVVDLMDHLRRFPLTGDKQVVILKEAQGCRDLIKLENYVARPVPSTVFVIAHKHKKIDGKTKFAKALKKHAVVLESKRLRDYEVPKWIRAYCTGRGLQIDGHAAALLEDHLGNDLSVISSSIDKLVLNLGEGATITSAEIERYIGISKEYNVFELNNAIMARDEAKAIRIARYFESNPKAGPLVLVIGTLLGLFSKLLLVHGSGGIGEREVASVLKLPPFIAKSYASAARFYSRERCEMVLFLLRDYDLKSKGVGSPTNDDGALLIELIERILHPEYEGV